MVTTRRRIGAGVKGRNEKAKGGAAVLTTVILAALVLVLATSGTAFGDETVKGGAVSWGTENVRYGFLPDDPTLDDGQILPTVDSDPQALGSISYSPVPEPATMSLLVLGGLALVRRRRRT